MKKQVANKFFLGATVNYSDLQGAVNLYKNFLPQAWMFNCESGVSAFVHPEGVYDDPKGGALREKMYARLRKHFVFANERKLFPEVDHHTAFSLNVYGGPQIVSFDTICNLYDASTIIECYEGETSKPIPKVKDESGKWETKGHPDRIIHITKRELQSLSELFGGGKDWKSTEFVSIHAKELMEVLNLLSKQQKSVSDLKDAVYTTGMWHETNAQKDNIIEPFIGFSKSNVVVYSGAHIGLANPCYQTTRSNYRVNSDYDVIDLTQMPEDYKIRGKYRPYGDAHKYFSQIPITPWGKKVTEEYRLVNREMVGCTSERTLCVAICAPGVSFVNTVFGVSYADTRTMVKMAGYEAGLPYDFLVRSIGKNHVNYSTTMLLPIVTAVMDEAIVLRTLLLNCITKSYATLWANMWKQCYKSEQWSKVDDRLKPDSFSALTPEWKWDIPVRTDFERRQMLVELDVLVAMALGMSLKQLISIYELQFSVLQDYESDTWYDRNGRIAFTNNRSLTNVGFSRQEWENGIKGAHAGQKFYRTIMDDTIPGGPIERTIEYVAPFDRCNRELDYETAWRFFEEKYGGVYENN